MQKEKTTSKKHKIKTVLTILGVTFFLSSLFLVTVKSRSDSVKDESMFSKGVLAINTNKSTYKPNEKVEFGMASLDENGDTLCDSNLEIIIEKPNGDTKSLSTSEGDISVSQTCNINNNVTNNPDYIAYYYPADTGIYKVSLINKSNDNSIDTQFEVKND